MAKYIQDRIERNFFVTTKQEFMEVTSDSAGTWNLLIVDSTILAESSELVETFMEENPQAGIGVVSREENLSVSVRDATVFREPSSTDEFLVVVHYLLDQADRGYMRSV
jgi:hypothetical protein